MRQLVTLVVVLVGLVLVGCGNAAESDLTTIADAAFRAWAQQTGTPFQNPEYNVVSNDGTFAEIQILAELRTTPDEPWTERETVMECRNVDRVWQCNNIVPFNLEEVSQRAVEATSTTIQATSEAFEVQATRAMATATVARAELAEETSGLIAFVEIFEKDRAILFSQLYTFNPDNHAIAKLYESEGQISGLSWSPDGQRLVFTVSSNGAIYVVDVATSEVTQIVESEQEVGSPRWSSDGAKLVYSPAHGGSITVVEADGSQSQELVPGSFDDNYTKPEWSPDQSLVSFLKGGSPDALYFVNTDGSNLRTVALDFSPFIPLTDELALLSQTWSPDGTQLVLTTLNYTEDPQYQGYQSFLFNVATEELSPLQQPGESLWVQGWSQDGTQLYGYFDRSARLGEVGLYALSLDGADATLLVADSFLIQPGESSRCKVSPDGTRLLATSENLESLILDVADRTAMSLANMMGQREDLDQGIHEGFELIGESEFVQVTEYYTCWSPQ